MIKKVSKLGGEVSNKMNTGSTKETTLYEILLQGMADHTRRACHMQKNQIICQQISAYYPTGGIKKVMPNQEPNALARDKSEVSC